MKKIENSEEIQLIEKKTKPKDADELKEQILSGKLTLDEVAKLGSNRGQLFVRIPQPIARMLELKKGQKLRFVLEGKQGDYKLRIEVEK